MNDAAPEQRRQVARCGGTALSRGSKRHTADRAEGPRPVGFWKESATDQKLRYDAEKISSLNPRRSSERPGVEFFSPSLPTLRICTPGRFARGRCFLTPGETSDRSAADLGIYGGARGLRNSKNGCGTGVEKMWKIVRESRYGAHCDRLTTGACFCTSLLISDG
jgi:hypothetical protein